jgi:HSP20 family protein
MWPGFDMDRVFEGFFRNPLGAIDDSLRSPAGWAPALEVTDGEREVTVRAELPGIDPKDLDISVAGNLLTLSGEKRSEKDDRDGRLFRSERMFGSFRRSVTLPEGVDPDKVTADYDKGVLTVKVGKDPKVQPRRIKIAEKK